ncbi:MAG: hypothetical protein Q7T18_01600 [Sedimentisphaerales bacterium]|nr:hypothetical protein [Sedimentisphaerales bacterium]
MANGHDIFRPPTKKDLKKRKWELFVEGEKGYKKFIAIHSYRPWEHDADAIEELIEFLEEFLKYVRRLYGNEVAIGGMEYGIYRDIAKRIGWFFKRYGLKDGLIKKFDAMVRALGKKGGSKADMGEIVEIVEKIKELCRKLQKQIGQEAAAFK